MAGKKSNFDYGILANGIGYPYDEYELVNAQWDYPVNDHVEYLIGTGHGKILRNLEYGP